MNKDLARNFYETDNELCWFQNTNQEHVFLLLIDKMGDEFRKWEKKELSVSHEFSWKILSFTA